MASTSPPPGMLAEQIRQDQIANDLANASTPGYKADRTAQREFGELLLANRANGAAVGTPVDRGRRSTTSTPTSPPSRSRDTGEPLDFAITGEGFFAVRTAAGRALHAQRPVHRQPAGRARDRRRATPSSAAAAGPSASATTAASIRAASRSCALDNPRKEGDTLFTGTPRAPPAPAGAGRRARGLGRRPGALHGRHDRVAPRLRGRPAASSTTIDETLGKAATQVGSSRARIGHGLTVRRRRDAQDSCRTLADHSTDACSKDSTPPRPAWPPSSSASTPSPTTSPTSTRPATSTSASGSATSSTRRPGAPSAQGPRTGAGAAAVDAGRGFAAGRAAAHRPAARRRHPGRRLHPRQARRRPPGADPRRLAAARRAGRLVTLDRRAASSRRSPSPGTDPSRGRRSAADGTVRAGGRRSAASSSSRSARRRRCSRSATTPSSPPPQSGAARAAPAATTLSPGRARGLERRHGRRDGRHDRRPARLPARVQGDPDAGPDVGDRQRGQALMAASGCRRSPTRCCPPSPHRHGRATSRPTRPRSASSRCCSASSSRR